LTVVRLPYSGSCCSDGSVHRRTLVTEQWT
jgi:hypothetical protein